MHAQRPEDYREMKERLAERGVKVRHLLPIIFGDAARSILDKNPRPDDGPISRDPAQNRRSKRFGYAVIAVSSVAGLVGYESYKANQEAQREALECSVEKMDEANFSVNNPPTIAEAEMTIIGCIPTELQNSNTVARQAEITLSHMGIDIQFTND